MTITATKFTPEVLLSAPRRSTAVPNPAGTHALYTGKLAEKRLSSFSVEVIIHSPFFNTSHASLPVLLRLALEELRHQGPRPQVRVVDRAVREPRVHGTHVGLRHGVRLRGEPRQEHRPAFG